MLMTPCRSLGRSGGCVGVVAIFSSTSSPLDQLAEPRVLVVEKRGTCRWPDEKLAAGGIPGHSTAPWKAHRECADDR